MTVDSSPFIRRSASGRPTVTISADRLFGPCSVLLMRVLWNRHDLRFFASMLRIVQRGDQRPTRPYLTLVDLLRAV